MISSFKAVHTKRSICITNSTVCTKAEYCAIKVLMAKKESKNFLDGVFILERCAAIVQKVCNKKRNDKGCCQSSYKNICVNRSGLVVCFVGPSRYCWHCVNVLRCSQGWEQVCSYQSRLKCFEEAGIYCLSLRWCHGLNPDKPSDISQVSKTEQEVKQVSFPSVPYSVSLSVVYICVCFCGACTNFTAQTQIHPHIALISTLCLHMTTASMHTSIDPAHWFVTHLTFPFIVSGYNLSGNMWSK